MDPTKKKTILLIDDQRLIIHSMTTILEEWGYQVIGFTDPMEALLYFKENSFFLVICDLYMADLSGYKLLSVFLKERPEQACCLMTSAENDEPLLKRTISLKNVQGLLKKPISYVCMQETLQNFHTNKSIFSK
jgi:CheY-like chemotaxis protein